MELFLEDVPRRRPDRGDEATTSQPLAAKNGNTLEVPSPSAAG